VAPPLDRICPVGPDLFTRSAGTLPGLREHRRRPGSQEVLIPVDSPSRPEDSQPSAGNNEWTGRAMIPLTAAGIRRRFSTFTRVTRPGPSMSAGGSGAGHRAR
jgi:hypothetical protein